ncbi:cytochrome P450 [Emcibacter sp.]|uniref:cytochrome P450 n=1 Tax=Emcibacter sp. TaxID=1979954 RepID=UPI002AA76167|nr:cytochrome P450 [Emcibacter sp.]
MGDYANSTGTGCPLSALSDTFHLTNEQLEETFHRARAERPVFYLEDIGFWAVTKYEDIKVVLGDKERFSSEITLEPLAPVAPEVLQLFKDRGFSPRPTLSNNERDDHARIRNNALKAFSPARMKKLEPYIRQLVNEAINSFEADKKADLVRQMVYELPALVLFKLLGIPDGDVQKIKMWADSRLILSFGRPSVADQLVAAGHMADYWDYCLAHVRKRMEHPEDDLPSDMLATRNGDDSILTVEDINNVVFGLLLAGHETTTNMSGNAVLSLLEDLKNWDALVADPSLIKNAVEECLRFRPSVVAWRRLVKEPVELSGVKIPAGERILCYLPSGNRDEEVFDNGEVLDLHRKDARSHVSFGYGRHFCLGAALARFELKVLLEELTRRLPGVRLCEGQDFEAVEAVQFRGPKELWIEWD